MTIGACIGATFRGAGEIDSDPEIPQIYTITFGLIAGFLVWAAAIKVYPCVGKDLGKIKGAVLTGAIGGPLFFLLVHAFHWNETRIMVDIGFGLILGGIVGLLLGVLGFLLEG